MEVALDVVLGAKKEVGAAKMDATVCRSGALAKCTVDRWYCCWQDAPRVVNQGVQDLCTTVAGINSASVWSQNLLFVPIPRWSLVDGVWDGEGNVVGEPLPTHNCYMSTRSSCCT